MDGFPLFSLCILVSILVQWIGFIPAYIFQTERFYDLVGTFTFLTLISIALGFGPPADARSWLLAMCVTIWSIRLGTFLFIRFKARGSDRRFDQIKTSFGRFLLTWTLQGLWVSFSLASALAAITSPIRIEIDLLAILGTMIWIVGFGVEVVADWQKSQFRRNRENQDRFIQSGLWAWSRHPNYLGEILLWIGISVIALPVLQGWQYLTLFSPVFITFLITRVSGIPLLEAHADQKWGGDKNYEDYKRQTPVLLPKIWRIL